MLVYYKDDLIKFSKVMFIKLIFFNVKIRGLLDSVILKIYIIVGFYVIILGFFLF